MNGIDISSWQAGINLSSVPYDFCIVKSSEGNNYVSPEFKRQSDAVLAKGKLLGVYHYINGAGAKAEAQHFYNTIKPCIGKAIVCLDWEDGGNSQWGNLTYLDSLIKELKKLVSTPIFLYCSLSAFPWGIASQNGCKTWVAQYADMNTTGYQSNPWNQGAYDCDIRQYSGTGRLNGYGGNLDLDKAYFDAATWKKYAGQTTSSNTPTKPTTSVPELRYRVSTDQSGKSWLPEMINYKDTGGSSDDFAGNGQPIRWLAIKMNGWYQVKTSNGWLPKVHGYNINDLNTGCAGDGTPITAIRCVYQTPDPKKTGVLYIEYQAYTNKWLPAMKDLKDTGGSSDDFAGNGQQITRFRAKLIK